MDEAELAERLKPEPEMMRAARLGDVATLERLIREGGDINAPAKYLSDDHCGLLEGLTPLMVAARSIDAETLTAMALMLEHGADVDAGTSEGLTAAWYAAGSGERWYDDEWKPAPDHAERLRFLLDAGADPRFTWRNGRTLMTEAARSGDPARVRLLLERGVPPMPDANLAGTSHASGLQFYEGIGVSETVIPELFAPPLGDFYSFQIPLFQAAESGSAECVRLLLDAGADPNQKCEGGHTPLSHAGSPEVVSVLLGAGASLEVTMDRYHYDLLEIVLDGGLPERFAVAQALLEAGAPLERTDAHGWTRLYRAAFRQQAEVVEWLLEQGASRDSDERASTPLHAICWQGQGDEEKDAAIERIVRALVAAGFSTEARDGEGRTPLHKAVGGDWRNEPAVRVLLELGAEPDPVDGYGQSPLHLAARSGESVCAEWLLARGADPLRQDSKGKTPVDLARAYYQNWQGYAATPPTMPPGFTIDWEKLIDMDERQAKHELRSRHVSDCYALLVAAAEGRG